MNRTPDLKALAISHRRAEAQALAAALMNAPGAADFQQKAAKTSKPTAAKNTGRRIL